MKHYYITTTLPYVNADPHIGFALEIVQADALARYHRLLGEEVVFNTGTDEHGLKIYKKALEAGLEPQAYCDSFAEKFHGLKDALNLSYTNFIRTTDPHHITAAQEFWKLCQEKGDIYLKNYQTNYCVGCEMEKTDSELDHGHCPIHPNLEIEQVDEENYFFRFSNYQKSLLELYAANAQFVVPEGRLNEITKFVEAGLTDFSISRLKSKMPWGIPVPGDEHHVMYVWFDALINYISTLGWPEMSFEKFWPGVQVAGKDNLRQQSAMWQAMLMSAGIANSSQIFIHGFITVEGQKISKSLGNIVSPYDLVAQYGTDAVRYFLLGGLPSYQDGDFSHELFTSFYTSRLVNGIGNLTSRTVSMLEKYVGGEVPAVATDPLGVSEYWEKFENALASYRFDEAVRQVDALVEAVDHYIDAQKPWALAKTDATTLNDVLYVLVEALRHIGWMIAPLMPATSEKLLRQLGVSQDGVFSKVQKWGGLAPHTTISKDEYLFPRLPDTRTTS